MGVVMMSTHVYITKNVDAAVEIQDILTKQCGSNIYDHAFYKPYRFLLSCITPGRLQHHARSMRRTVIARDKHLIVSLQRVRSQFAI
jgi:hypothetical protein